MNLERSIEEHDPVVSQGLRNRRYVGKFDESEPSGLSLFTSHTYKLHFADLIEELADGGRMEELRVESRKGDGRPIVLCVKPPIRPSIRPSCSQHGINRPPRPPS